MKEHVGIIVTKDGKSLFCKRSMKKKKLPGLWAFISGTCEPGETPEQTAEREAEEELGVTAQATTIMATQDLTELDTKLHFVLCDLTAGEPTIKEPDEIDELEWMTFDEFFTRFNDDQIGHGLIWLRQHPDIWQPHGL